MPPSAKAYSAYRSAEVGTLSQRDLVVKLYQGVERFLIQGKTGIQNGDRELALEGCQKAKRIIVELCSTLNFEVGGEVAGQLRDLYLFFISEITRASLEQDAPAIDKLLPVIATLREAWQSIPDEHANVTSMPTQGGGESGSSFSART